MRAFLFVAIALLGSALGDEEVPKEGDVLILNKANFDKVISSTNLILVKFCVEWCPHCKALAPEFAKAATKLSEEGSDIKLAGVDCNKEEELGDKYGISGVPTLKLFKNGTYANDYKGTQMHVLWQLLRPTSLFATLVSFEMQPNGQDKNVTFNTQVVIIHFTGDLCVGQSVETLSKEKDQQARNSELRKTFLNKYNEFWPTQK